LQAALRAASRPASAAIRASLIPRSHLLRAARSAALVRRRVGIITPRFPVSGGVDFGNTNVPVGMANTGNSTAPPGFVV